MMDRSRFLLTSLAGAPVMWIAAEACSCRSLRI
jgi:hypothetical protein